MKKLELSGVVGWDIYPSQVRDFLREASGADIEVRVSSPGGLIGAGLEIFNLFRNYTGKKTCIISGYAMSMMSYIPLAFDEIHVEDNAVYMIHNARGGVWGDHNDVLNYGGTLKGLSGVIAKAYRKRMEKAGKATSLEELIAAMDKETFYFGEEIVDAGFADKLIDTDADKDSSSAVASAKAVFGECVAKMTQEAQAVREDLNRASAMLDMVDLAAVSAVALSPAQAGTSQEEVQQMATLAELLAANPAAKTEHDAALASARTEGVAAGKQEVQSVIAEAAPYLNSSKYPEIVKQTALKVIQGAEAKATLIAAVAAVDAVTESAAAAAAAAATDGATPAPAAPAGAAVVDPAEPVNSEAGLDAAVAQFKGV